MRWPWRREPNGAAHARAEAEAKLAAAKKATPRIERMADALARDTSAEEFVERMARAFGLRSS